MKPDQLFILKADFLDHGEPWFCPGCAEVLGVLEYYPRLKTGIQIHQVDYPRPRPAIASLLGEEFQSCPVLVLGAEPAETVPGVRIQHSNGHAFVNEPRGICLYLSHVHGIGKPH